MDKTGVFGGTAVAQSLLESIQDEMGLHRARNPPADDPSREGVDDERDMDEARPGRDVGEVREPEPVGAGAWNSRLRRSSGQGAVGSGTVIFFVFARMAPARRISGSGALTRVAVLATDPLAQRLSRAPELRRYRLHGRPLRSVAAS